MLDTGTQAFMLICTMLVFLMTFGLAFFYGGLSRRKNVINTMLMSVAVFGVVGVAWVVAGWSIAYGGTGANPFVGGLDQLGCADAVRALLAEAAGTPTAVQALAGGADAPSLAGAEAAYPAITDIAFQMAFAMIATAIITGAVAGRAKFGAVVAFCGAWSLLVYAPLAHMVWSGEGSLIGSMIGALDFAGGDVVHISSGLSGLVLCLLLGGRRGHKEIGYRPHNVPFVLLGASLLLFGWFGFNAGSAFAADGIAGLALLNTAAAAAASTVSWLAVERLRDRQTTLVGASTGLVAGLVVITPAAGFVEPLAAVAMGAIGAPCCYFAIAVLKRALGFDDALDAFGCHFVGGVVGGLLTGVLCVPELSWTELGGLLYTGDASLLLAQAQGIVVSCLFAGVGSLVIGFAVKLLMGGSLRVSAAAEARGLDATLHCEHAYPAFNGLD